MSAPPASSDPVFQGAVIPALKDEVPGVRIGWRFNDIAGALHAAKDDHKPVILVFARLTNINTRGNWFRYYLANTLRCPTFNTFAGQAHFVLVDVDTPGDGQKAYGGLETGSLPSMVDLTVEDTNVSEAYHSDGPQNEASAMAAPMMLGLKPGAPSPNSWLGSAAPLACGAGQSDEPAALPDDLPEVEVKLPG